MQQWIKEVARGKRGSKDLTYEETRQAAHEMLSGNATDAQIAAYFVALRLKMETPDELLAFVHELRAFSTPLPTSESVQSQVVDFASPYNGRKAFAATIPTSILLAEHGIPAFLHSSEALPPKYGISIKAILAQLEVNVEATQTQLAQSLDTTNLGFAWTEAFCLPLANMRAIRKEIGVRTLLNTAEKLLNLAQSNRIMMGAFHRTAINKIVPLMHGLSYENVFIVQGAEGSEDLPVHRNSFFYELTEEASDSIIIKPSDYGLLDKNVPENPLTIEEQTEIILSLLAGEKKPTLTHFYNQVVLNAGLRYHVFGQVGSIEEGVELAKEQLRSGRGLNQLEKWKKAQSTDFLAK